MSTFFVSPSTIFKLMYFNWKYFSVFRLFHFSLNTNPNRVRVTVKVKVKVTLGLGREIKGH